jgi:hypothetical protein
MALQLRESPVGFRSEFHVSSHPQWVFILQGQMEIGLQDGSSQVFRTGSSIFLRPTCCLKARFSILRVHGHCSRQVGREPLINGVCAGLMRLS